MRRLLPLFIVFHATAIFLSSVPTPGQGLNRKNWADPTVQEEFATWANLLGVESEALQDNIYEAAKLLQNSRDAVMEPFERYLKQTGSAQSWKMFVAAHRYPTRLQIQVREGVEWETVFYEHDPVATWRAERFGNERMRASVFAWGWSSAARRWTSACQGFAEELYAERPALKSVRCRFLKRRSPSPEQVLSGTADEGEFVLERLVPPPGSATVPAESVPAEPGPAGSAQ